MTVAVFSFLAIFLLIASAGLLLFYREAMLQRISAVTSPRSKPKGFVETMQQTGVSLTSMVEQFEKVMPRSKEETSVINTRLVRAGYRNESAIKLFYGAKLAVPLLLCVLLLVTGIGRFSPFFLYLCALGLGFLIPDFWLGNRISKLGLRTTRS